MKSNSSSDDQHEGGQELELTAQEEKAVTAAKYNQVDQLMMDEKRKQLVAELKDYTRAEVSQHTTESDCWIVYKNEVFDVSSFINIHPAGPQYLMDYAGHDTSVEFDQVGHSEFASKQMQSFKIGNIVKEDYQEPGAVVSSASEKWVKEAELVSRKQVSHNSVIFTFKMEGGLELQPGEHISIIADVNGDQIMRPYTPIECRPDGFDCLIKIYPNGAMSQYLDKTEIGQKLNIRGVFSDVTYSKHELNIPGFVSDLKVKNLSMIAGGTGITPCYQIIKAVLNNPDDKTKINLVYSNTTQEDILLKEELQNLQKSHPDRFKVHFTLTQKGLESTEYSTRRVDSKMLSDHLVAPTLHKAENYVLVCGPSGFSETCKNLLAELAYNYKTFLGMPNKYPEVPTNWLGRLYRYNPFIVMWAVIVFILLIIWSFSRGENGLGGRFCIEGFENEWGATRYAYRLVRDPAWSNGSEVPDEGCNVDPKIGQIISWVMYIPHQLIQWWILYKAQQEKPKYQEGWRWFNWWMLYTNAFFMGLKLLSNALTYNAMSSHLPLWFGQGAVFNMLLIVLAMQVPVRGMCCGSCSRGCKVGSKQISKGEYWTEMAMFMRKYHGYYIAFGVTSDWYYHPLESSPGHLSGIANDLMILWQTICIYTPAHRNKWWCIACEFIVTFHGPLIALGRGGGAGMFGFGFTIVFMCSGQWGLPLNKATRAMLASLFFGLLVANYGLGWSKKFGNEPVGWADMQEVVRIPMLYYIIMGLYFILYVSLRWINNIKNKTAQVVLSILGSIVAMSFGFVTFMMIVGFN